MRFACFIVLLTGIAAVAQPPPVLVPKEPEPRYGVASKLKAYPQASAKEVLASAIEAIEKRETTYLAAHLLDPGFVDARVTERGKTLEPAVEVELTRLRDFQYANPDRFAPSDRLPLDRLKFLAAIIELSRARGFKLFAADVADKLRDDPDTLRDFKKILREGTFADEGAGTRAEHPTVKYKALYFKKVGDRWFLENRQSDESAKKELKE